MSGKKKLGRTSAHRTSLYRNLATNLIKYEQIRTTQAKAKGLRSFAEKIISRAKTNNLNSKRLVLKDIHNRDIIKKLFGVIAPRYENRKGGYIKIIKLKNRRSDNALMCMVKLLP